MSTTATYKGQALTTVENATKKLLTAGMLMEDDITLTDVSGSGGAVKMGVLRPDAELVKTWSADFYAVADEGLTIPAYTTTAQALKATENLDTYDGDPLSYRYFVVERTLTIPEYSIATLAKGREDHVFCSAAYEWVYQPSGQIRTIDGSKTYGQYSQMAAMAAVARYIYWSSATAISPYTSTAYGFYQTITAPTITSNKTITIRTPAIGVRGHATYLVNTFMNAMTDARCQYVIELWRQPLDAVNGWIHGTQFEHIADCIANNSAKLT